MDSYVQANLHYAFYSSMHSFSNYGHVATTASNFSVSSGGSSGGGFSGGGAAEAVELSNRQALAYPEKS